MDGEGLTWSSPSLLTAGEGEAGSPQKGTCPMRNCRAHGDQGGDMLSPSTRGVTGGSAPAGGPMGAGAVSGRAACQKETMKQSEYVDIF